jgi:hypothetical protein
VRVIVSGSRNWDDEKAVHRALDRQYAKHQKSGSDKPFVVVHGNAKGADTHAKNWAMKRGVAHEPHPADWARYGRSAGPVRNKQMVDAGADAVLAFPKPGGRGTQDLMNRASKAGIRVHPARDSQFKRQPGRR